MTTTTDELWVLTSGGRVMTENGRLIATFTSDKDATTCIDDHNLEIELDAPEEPEVVRTRERANYERLLAYQKEDPQGFRLFEMIANSANRCNRLLSLRAPIFIIHQALDQIEDRVKTLRDLHPMPVYDDEVGS